MITGICKTVVGVCYDSPVTECFLVLHMDGNLLQLEIPHFHVRQHLLRIPCCVACLRLEVKLWMHQYTLLNIFTLIVRFGWFELKLSEKHFNFISQALISFSALDMWCVVCGISRVLEGFGTHGACRRELCQSC